MTVRPVGLPSGLRRFSLVLATTLLLGANAARAASREEPRDGSPAGGAVLPVRSAVVDFKDLARQEAMGLAPRVTAAPRVRLEREGVNEMDEEPGAAEVGSALPQSMLTPPPFVPYVASPSPSASFIGLDDIPMVDSSYIIIPPDVGGAVGPTKVMETFNNNYRIRNKDRKSVV